MAFDFKSFAREVHKNAKAHGWYDPPPTAEERIAAIHSEWSEAFQAWRKDEPAYTIKQICMSKDKLADCEDTVYCNTCEHALHKPDGWAVELIDGVLRILEWMANDQVDIELLMRPGLETAKKIKWGGADELPLAVNVAHTKTSEADECRCMMAFVWEHLAAATCGILIWLESTGLDPIAIMQQKHAYNRTRPYRHGGKKC